jgi:protoporphyrin/coproporphyrin ferrochelatase
LSHLDVRNAIGVVLFQLGGPESLEGVEPFLYQLFSDPDIIDFPFARLARPALAGLIASRRARHVREHYARIGGKSPIGELTGRQAGALERELAKSIEARVFVCMRYSRPSTAEIVEEISRQRLRELVLLPLYPQYSLTTSGSSLNEWQRRYATLDGRRVPTKLVRNFYHHAGYLEALVERINLGLDRFEARPDGQVRRDDVCLVFSAHGVPVKSISAGDPYQAQVEATVRLAMARGGWRNPHRLCYQSRVGPGKWLQPSLDATLEDLAARGTRAVLVVPVSFVTDHVETMHEIDIEAREAAGRLGIGRFEVMPALNDSPAFIRALADLVLAQAARTDI